MSEGAALLCVYLQVSPAAPDPSWIQGYCHASSNQPYFHQALGGELNGKEIRYALTLTS